MTGPASGGTERGTRAPSSVDRDAGGRRRGPDGPRARARPPPHHRIPAPGLRLRRRPERLPVLGGRPRRRTARGASTSRDFFHDYTPGYLYVLWLVGIVGKAVGGVGDLIKIPPILADLAIGWLVWSMVRELGGRRPARARGGVRRGRSTRSAGSTASSWGQVDSFGVVFLLLGLRELWRDQPERAGDLHRHRGDHQAPARDPGPARRGRHDPARALAGRRRRATGDGPRRSGRGRRPDPDRRPSLPAVRPPRLVALDPVRACRPVGSPPADRRRRRRLPVPDRQRLQPVGARRLATWAQPRANAASGSATPRARRRAMRRRASRCSVPVPAIAVGTALLARGVPRRPVGRGARARPADPARRACGPRARVLRPADPRPRALRLPVLRARGRSSPRSRRGGGSPTRVLSVATFANMYVVLTTLYTDNPSIQRLAGDRASDPVAGGRGHRGPAPHARVRLGVRSSCGRARATGSPTSSSAPRSSPGRRSAVADGRDDRRPLDRSPGRPGSRRRGPASASRPRRRSQRRCGAVARRPQRARPSRLRRCRPGRGRLGFAELGVVGWFRDRLGERPDPPGPERDARRRRRRPARPPGPVDPGRPRRSRA